MGWTTGGKLSLDDLHHFNINHFFQLTLISQIYDVNIVSYRRSSKGGVLIPTSQILPTESLDNEDNPTIHLIYDNNHYDALVPVDNAIAGNNVIGPSNSDSNCHLQDNGKLFRLG